MSAPSDDQMCGHCGETLSEYCKGDPDDGYCRECLIDHGENPDEAPWQDIAAVISHCGNRQHALGCTCHLHTLPEPVAALLGDVFPEAGFESTPAARFQAEYVSIANLYSDLQTVVDLLKELMQRTWEINHIDTHYAINEAIEVLCSARPPLGIIDVEKPRSGNYEEQRTEETRLALATGTVMTPPKGGGAQ